MKEGNAKGKCTRRKGNVDGEMQKGEGGEM
jgi:hypothetical protein